MSTTLRVLVACALGAAALAAAADPTGPTFGFKPMEIYKVGNASGALRVGDANGDGFLDLLVANNEKVKIEVLLQRKPGEKVDATPVEGANEPGSDQRFTREGLPVTRSIKAMVAADWNGDGLTDVAHYTDPPELSIVLRTKSGWGEPATFPIKDGINLETADVTGDGKLDLVLLGKAKLHILAGKGDGKFAAPEALPTTEEDFGWVWVRDVNGDKRPDLVLFKGDDEAPVRLRIGTATGFRPEIAPVLGPASALDCTDIGRGPAQEILVIERRTGRLRVLAYAEAPAAKLGSPQFLPLPQAKSPRDRVVAVGDVDGDGRTDIVVVEQKASACSVFRQDAQGSLSRAEQFPTFSGVTDVTIGDVTGDGKPDVIVCSPVERAVGVHEWRDGRLQFARPLAGMAVEGKPLAVACCDADGAAPLDLAVAFEGEKKRRAVQLFVTTKTGATAGPAADVKLTENPDGLVATDLDQDGVAELVCMSRYDTAQILRVTRGATPALAVVSVPEGLGRGLWAKLEVSAFAAGDADGDGKGEGLIARKGFARAVALDPATGDVRILDQFNAAASEDEVVAAAAIDVDGDKVPEIVLANKTQGELAILTRGADKVYRQTGAVPLPGFGLQGLLAADLTGDGRADLLAMGERRLAVVPLGGIEARLDVLGLFEPSEERARLNDVAVGDLNGDDVPDVIVTEGVQKRCALLAIEAAPAGSERPLKLRTVTAFPIFEQKANDQRRGGGQVAREMLVADVTHDGKKDLVLLVHDRILIYPQE